jgi:hypothetical protein
MITQEKLISWAKRSVPSFKWALAAGGLLALASIVVGWGFNLASLFLVSGVLLVLAMAFIALNWVSKLKAAKATLMAVVLAWALLLFLVLSLVFVLTSATFNWPWPIKGWISNQLAVAVPGEGSVPNQIPAKTGAPEARRIETLEVEWVINGLPDSSLDELLNQEVADEEYWWSDDNLKAISTGPREFILRRQNHAMARQLLEQIGAASKKSRLGSVLAVLEMNASRSLTLPFGAFHIDETPYLPGGPSLGRKDLLEASSGIDLLYSESRAPYDDDPDRDEAINAIQQRARPHQPSIHYERLGTTAKVSIKANALELADWIDRLASAGELSTPLPKELRLLVLTEMEAIPFHPKKLCDVLSVVEKELAPHLGLSDEKSRPKKGKNLSTSWLSIKGNGADQAFYRVEWLNDSNYWTRGGPEEEPEPRCRVSLFRCVQIAADEFEKGVGQFKLKKPTPPDGVLLFGSDTAVSGFAEKIKDLVGERPVIELPLNTSIDDALAVAGQCTPAVVILSPDAFGKGQNLHFRTFINDILSKRISSHVLRVCPVEDPDQLPFEWLIGDFESDRFDELSTLASSGKSGDQQWQMIRNYLAKVL